MQPSGVTLSEVPTESTSDPAVTDTISTVVPQGVEQEAKGLMTWAKSNKQNMDATVKWASGNRDWLAAPSAVANAQGPAVTMFVALMRGLDRAPSHRPHTSSGMPSSTCS